MTQEDKSVRIEAPEDTSKNPPSEKSNKKNSKNKKKSNHKSKPVKKDEEDPKNKIVENTSSSGVPSTSTSNDKKPSKKHYGKRKKKDLPEGSSQIVADDANKSARHDDDVSYKTMTNDLSQTESFGKICEQYFSQMMSKQKSTYDVGVMKELKVAEKILISTSVNTAQLPAHTYVNTDKILTNACANTDFEEDFVCKQCRARFRYRSPERLENYCVEDDEPVPLIEGDKICETSIATCIESMTRQSCFCDNQYMQLFGKVRQQKLVPKVQRCDSGLLDEKINEFIHARNKVVKDLNTLNRYRSLQSIARLGDNEIKAFGTVKPCKRIE